MIVIDKKLASSMITISENKLCRPENSNNFGVKKNLYINRAAPNTQKFKNLSKTIKINYFCEGYNSIKFWATPV